MQGLTENGESAPQMGGGAMQVQKRSKQKQRRDEPARVNLYAAALFWLVRLILMLWDRYTR